MRSLVFPALAQQRAAVAVLAPAAHAVVFGFQGITLNNPADVAIGTAQLTPGCDVAQCRHRCCSRFTMSAPGQSVIEQVFFEQGVLGSLASITNRPAYPSARICQSGQPAGGQLAEPEVRRGLRAGADSPAPFNGVNNTLSDSETLGLLFNLAGGKTFSDVLSGLGDSSFRVGVHVIAYSSGGSESFINGPISIGIPDPATAALLLVGAVGGGLLRRRR